MMSQKHSVAAVEVVAAVHQTSLLFAVAVAQQAVQISWSVQARSTAVDLDFGQSRQIVMNPGSEAAFAGLQVDGFGQKVWSLRVPKT